MIATALVFVFGALVAALAALLLVPLVWRQAQRLARRDFLATMPTSLNEIRAEVDRVRAEAALNIRRQEIVSAQVRQAHAGERADLGRYVMAKVEAERKLRELGEQNGVLAEEVATLTAALQNWDGRLSESEDAHRTLRRDLDMRAEELEALAERFREIDTVADERRVRLVTSETRVDELESELRAVRREFQREIEARASAEALLDETRGRLNYLEGEDPELPLAVTSDQPMEDGLIVEDAPAESSGEPDRPSRTEPRTYGGPLAVDRKTQVALEDLRELTQSVHPPEAEEVRRRVADIAADILYASAVAQGSGSPAAALLESGPAQDPSSLAAQVRSRRATTAMAGPAEDRETLDRRAFDDATEPVGAEPANASVDAEPADGEPMAVEAKTTAAIQVDAAQAEPSEYPDRVPAAAVKIGSGAKRGRGGARSRQRSPR